MLTPEQVGSVISGLLEEYPGHDYDLLHRNCCHFADEFCRRLGVGGIPSWLHRLARLGAGVESAIQAAYDLRDSFYEGRSIVSGFTSASAREAQQQSIYSPPHRRKAAPGRCHASSARRANHEAA